MQVLLELVVEEALEMVIVALVDLVLLLYDMLDLSVVRGEQYRQLVDIPSTHSRLLEHTSLKIHGKLDEHK
jgi:hypothetical protein